MITSPGSLTSRTSTLWHLFSSSAERAADATALEIGPHKLTYAELHTSAEQLAATIESRIAGPAPVGLLAGRDAGTYAGYLAVLRTGRPVVPLSPRFPAARLAQMCRSAGVGVLLTDPGSAELAAGIARDVPGVEVCVHPGDGEPGPAKSRAAPGPASAYRGASGRRLHPLHLRLDR
ncbi:AMP-binding protein [Nonomuraea antimicrobica]